MIKAIFLDKDGTLVDNSQYPEKIPSDELLESSVLDGLIHLQNKGFKLIIISNQPWIAKKRASLEQIENIFKSLINKLSEKQIIIHDYFYCPHQTSDNCNCKKPSPNLILKAAKKHNIDLSQSFIIGDSFKDILTGKNAKIKTILVTEFSENLLKNFTEQEIKLQNNLNPDFKIKNINETTKII